MHRRPVNSDTSSFQKLQLNVLSFVEKASKHALIAISAHPFEIDVSGEQSFEALCGKVTHLHLPIDAPLTGLGSIDHRQAHALHFSKELDLNRVTIQDIDYLNG